MGIAQRKAGTVVRCPKCQGQVVVPIPEGFAPPVPTGPTEAPPGGPAPSAPPPTAPAGVFEESDFEKVFQEPQLLPPPDPLAGPAGIAAVSVPAPAATAAAPVEPLPKGLLLTPGLLTMLCVLVMLLIGIAFFVGVLLGRASVGESRDTRGPPAPAEIISVGAIVASDSGNESERSRS